MASLVSQALARISMSDKAGVVLTGVFGGGKTSVVEEMAELLEQRGIAWARPAFDLDGPGRHEGGFRMQYFCGLLHGCSCCEDVSRR